MSKYVKKKNHEQWLWAELCPPKPIRGNPNRPQNVTVFGDGDL